MARMSSRNSSSVVSTGCTVLSWPCLSAVATNPNCTRLNAKPMSQIFCLTAWPMRLALRADDSGAVSTPMRCSTEVRALVKAARAAKMMATHLL